MSWRLVEQVLSTPALKATDCRILGLLAKRGNDDGSRCYPSVGTLADESGLDERNVRRALERLLAEGWIVRTARSRQHRAAEYRIVVARLAKSGAPATPRRTSRAGATAHPGTSAEGALVVASVGDEGSPERALAPSDSAELVTQEQTQQHPPTPTADAAGPSGDRFNLFLKHYPEQKQTRLPEAERLFRKHCQTDEQLAAMIDAVERQKRWPQWNLEGGRYIPSVAKWLRKQRWKDRPQERQTLAHSVRARGPEPPRPSTPVGWRHYPASEARVLGNPSQVVKLAATGRLVLDRAAYSRWLTWKHHPLTAFDMDLAIETVQRDLTKTSDPEELESDELLAAIEAELAQIAAARASHEANLERDRLRRIEALTGRRS